MSFYTRLIHTAVILFLIWKFMTALLTPHKLARQAQIKALNTPRHRKRTSVKPSDQSAPRTSATQEIGLKHERRAAYYLQDHGLHILLRNQRTRIGEIDIIATDEQSVIFVEVRYRACNRFGGACASIDRAKQLRIIRSAQQLLPALYRHYFHNQVIPYRFDVVAIEHNGIHWITNAFGA